MQCHVIILDTSIEQARHTRSMKKREKERVCRACSILVSSIEQARHTRSMKKREKEGNNQRKTKTKKTNRKRFGLKEPHLSETNSGNVLPLS